MQYVHCLPNVTEECTGLANLDRLVETFPRRANEHLGLIVDFADRVSSIQVGVIPYRVLVAISGGSLCARTIVVHRNI